MKIATAISEALRDMGKPEPGKAGAGHLARGTPHGAATEARASAR